MYAASMHCADVDTSQTIIRGWEDDNPEMRDRMPVEFGRQLGQRTG